MSKLYKTMQNGRKTMQNLECGMSNVGCRMWNVEIRYSRSGIHRLRGDYSRSWGIFKIPPWVGYSEMVTSCHLGIPPLPGTWIICCPWRGLVRK